MVSWLKVLAAGLILMCAGAALGAEPPRGSPLRAAVLDGLRPRVEADIGQAVKFKVSTINVDGNWAFVSLTPLQADGTAIDWSKTRFAQAFASDAMSDMVLALLRKQNGGWRIAEYALGPTDVTWEEWIPKYHLSRAFFLGQAKPGEGQADAPGSQPAAVPPGAGPAPIELLKVRINQDCEALDLATWAHPTRTVIERRKAAHLRWAALCQKRRYPIFGMDFDYDPQGQTSDFFNPLFNDLLVANGRWPFSIVDGRDELMINVSAKGKSGLAVEYSEAPEFGTAPASPAGASANGEPPPQPGADQDAAPAADQPDAGQGAAPTTQEQASAAAPAGPSVDALKRDAAFKNYTAALASLTAYEKSDDVAQWQKGLEEAEQATVLDPSQGDYWRALGYAYSLVASIDTTAATLAEDALNKAISRNGKDSASHLLLARLQLARAAFAPALDHLEAVVTLKPELADSALIAEMCRAYLADGLGARGEAFFTARLDASPKSNPLRLGKAILLGERGATADALPIAQAVADDPKATQEDANKARELIAGWKGGAQ